MGDDEIKIISVEDPRPGYVRYDMEAILRFTLIEEGTRKYHKILLPDEDLDGLNYFLTHEDKLRMTEKVNSIKSYLDLFTKDPEVKKYFDEEMEHLVKIVPGKIEVKSQADLKYLSKRRKPYIEKLRKTVDTIMDMAYQKSKADVKKE